MSPVKAWEHYELGITTENYDKTISLGPGQPRFMGAETNIKGPRYISKGVDEHWPLVLYDRWSQTDYYNGNPEMNQEKFDILVDRRRLERIDLEADEEMKEY